MPITRPLPPLPALLLSLLAASAHAAPVNFTGIGWQRTLEENDRTLTYSFDFTGGRAIDGTVTVPIEEHFAALPQWREIISDALNTWGDSAGIRFVEVPDNGAPAGAVGAQGDLRFDAHRFPEDFYSIAYAYFPPPADQTETTAGESLYGDVSYNTDYPLNADDMTQTTVHELGHALGLSHNLDPDSVMYALGATIPSAPSEHDLADLRALYFPQNAPAAAEDIARISSTRDWLTLSDGSTDARRSLRIDAEGVILTHGEQRTGIKGTGASLSSALYGFSAVDLVMDRGARIATDGHNAYGIAARHNNTIVMNGQIDTAGYSADGIAVLGDGNTVETGSNSLIRTRGASGNGIFLGAESDTEPNIVHANGRIETSGAGAAGIYSVYGGQIALNGSIATRGDRAAGIASDQYGELAIDLGANGRIDTAGVFAPGILVRGTDNVIHVAGEIETWGRQSMGIYSFYGVSGITTVDGTITTNGDFSDAISMHAIDNTITVNGTLRTHGTGSTGILGPDGAATVVHNGLIDVTGADSAGIRLARGGNLVVINGEVRTHNGNAITLGSHDTPAGSETNHLALNGTPVIVGDIVNDSTDDSAHVSFGQPGIPVTFSYAGSFAGNMWTGDVVAGQVMLTGGDQAFSRLTVHPDAMLGGTTHLAGDVVNFGTLTPGHASGTLSIGGNYLQQGEATLQFNLAGTQSDLLSIDGNAAFDGSSRIALRPLAPVAAGSFTLVNSTGALSGSPLVDAPASAVLGYTLNTTAHTLGIEVSRTPYASFAQDARQRTLADAFDRELAQAGNDTTGDDAEVLFALDSLARAEDLGLSLDAMMPDSYAVLPEAALYGLRAAGRALPTLERRLTAAAPSLYAQTFVLDAGREAGRGLAGYRFNGVGLIVGADRVDGDSLLGAAISYQGMEIDHDASLSQTHSDSLIATLRGAVAGKRWQVEGRLSAGHQWDRSQRSIDAPALTRMAHDKSQADMVLADIEGRYRLTIGAVALTPYAGIDYAAYWRDDTREYGAGTLDAEIGPLSARSAQTRLGVALDSPVTLPAGIMLDSQLRLGWNHELLDTSYRYRANLVGASLAFEGADLGRDHLEFGLSLRTRAGEAGQAGIDLDYVHGSHDHALNARVSFTYPF